MSDLPKYIRGALGSALRDGESRPQTDRGPKRRYVIADLTLKPLLWCEAERSQLEISPLYGESIGQIVGDFLTMPAAIKERLKRSLKR